DLAILRFMPLRTPRRPACASMIDRTPAGRKRHAFCPNGVRASDIRPNDDRLHAGPRITRPLPVGRVPQSIRDWRSLIGPAFDWRQGLHVKKLASSITHVKSAVEAYELFICRGYSFAGAIRLAG